MTDQPTSPAATPEATPEALAAAADNARAALTRLGITDVRVEPILLGQAARRAQQGAATGVDDLMAVARETQAVLNAKDALTKLAREDAALAARVEKILPGHAVRRAQKDLDTSTEALMSAARRGPLFLKEIFNQAAAPLTLMQRYEEIAAPLHPKPREKGYGYGRHPNPNPHNYNPFADEFAMQGGLGGPWMMDPRHRYEMDRMAFEMDRHIPPREEARIHAMHLREARERNQFYHFYEALRLTLTEKDEAEQEKLARQLLADAEPRHTYHFASLALRMGRFSLLERVLPDALSKIEDLHAHAYFQQRFVFEVMHCVPETAGLISALLDHKQFWGKHSYSRCAIDLSAMPQTPQELLEKALHLTGMHLENRDWLLVVEHVATRYPNIARNALGRVRRIAGDHDCNRQFAQVLARVAAQGSGGILPDLLTHEMCKDVPWHDFLSQNAAKMPADALKALTRSATKHGHWPLVFRPGQMNGCFVTQETAEVFLASLPKGYVDSHMLDFFKTFAAALQQKRDGGMRALKAYPAFSRLPAFLTLKSFGLNAQHLHHILPHLDLTMLTPEERGEVLVQQTQNNVTAGILSILASGPCPQACLDSALRKTMPHAATYESIAIAARALVKAGAMTRDLSPQQLEALQVQTEAFDRWERVARCLPPVGLLRVDPAPYKPALVAELTEILRREGYQDDQGRIYAYKAMALFQSGDRVLQYLKKWGQPGSSQPLHNLLQGIQLPEDLSGVNLKDWGDAVLRHGPDMAKLVKFCRNIPSPARTDDGGSWSLVKTREIAAQFVYARGGEHRALAALCHKHSVSEQSFNTALDIVLQTPAMEKDLPELDIDGTRFGLENARFRRLANDDIRGLFLGELTDCCQSIGGHGTNCAHHGYTSPNGGFYVVETQGGEIIGQTWAWRGEKGELVFDSLEMLRGRVSAEQWQSLAAEVVKEISAKKAAHGITAFLIGSSGETPASFAQNFAKTRPAGPVMTYAAYAPPKDAPPAVEAAVPRDYRGYRDSNTQYVIWQKPAKPAPKRAAKPK